MIRNYIKTSFRSLFKNKIYSFINIFGLMVGLTCFFLIALYIFDELTFDRFHKNADNIYRVIEQKTSAEGKESKVAAVAFNITSKAANELPEVSKVARLSMLGRANIGTYENTNTFYEQYWIINDIFFNVFDFKFLSGDRNTAMKDPYTVVMTASTARKYFGTDNVVGKTIRTDRDTVPYKVTAVLEDFPVNSHINFNLAISENTLNTNSNFAQFNLNDWSSNFYLSYFQLHPEHSAVTTSERLNKLVYANRSDEEKSTKSEFSLQPLKDIHFYSAGIDGNFGGGNVFYIYVFSIVALFVLLIACINYMNLTTARFASRAKEIAVRKVAGAARTNLVSQFFSEAMLVTFISLVLSVAMVNLFLPAFNRFTGKQLSFWLDTDIRIWMGVILVLVTVGLLAGAYPAFFQSRLKPYLLLKNKLDTGRSGLSIRRALVVFQFSLSIIMIISTLVVYLQMRYVNEKDMGFNKEQLVVVDINSGSVRRSAEAIKSEYERISSVKTVSVSSRVPGEWKVIPRVKVKNEHVIEKVGTDMYFMAIDDHFFQTLEIEIAKGRNFSSANKGDSSAVIVNESAARVLGISEPTEQMVEIPSLDFSGSIATLTVPFKARVVGIVKDFNFRSLREPVAPLILGYQNNPVHNIDYFVSRVSTENISGTLKQMEDVLHKIDPNHLFEYNFLDKQWALFYAEDRKRQTLFIGAAIMTILIACLGLFGLSTYAAQQRVKEIGIRKVLGASVENIVNILSKDFLKLVVLASIISIPVAWWAMNSWLNDFAYRVSISWWVFVVAAVIALIIAFATVSFHAIRAAIASPVKSLRTE